MSFRRSIEQDEQSRQSLPWAVAETVPELHGQSLAIVADVIERHAAKLQELFGPQGLSNDARNDGLDLGTEHKQLSPTLQPLARDIMPLFAGYRLHHRALAATDFLTMLSDEDRRRIQQLAATATAAELSQLPAPAMLRRLFPQDDVRLFEGRPLRFACSCSPQRVEGMLLGLGREEVESVLAERGRMEVTCEFCGRMYLFTPEECRALFA